MDTKDGTLGGGEILDYVDTSKAETTQPMLDEGVIRSFEALPYIKFLAIGAIIVIMVVLIFKIFRVRSRFRGKGIKNELNQVDRLKSRDKRILRANGFIDKITKFIEKTPFSVSKLNVEYMNYNLMRAGLKTPGGNRYMRAEEFNAILKMTILLVTLIGIICILFVSMIVGAIIIVSGIILINVVPKMVIRSIVGAKDNEIKNNFADMYLMVHYVIIADAGTTVASVLKSYSNTTSSKEMKRFVSVCIEHIETYGEYEATKYIIKDYREIPVVCKLMRLIKQANEGGDVVEELKGFRAELLREKRYRIEKKMEKIVRKANWSFNILMIILVQAIISAMAIYLEDLGGIGSFLG